MSDPRKSEPLDRMPRYHETDVDSDLGGVILILFAVALVLSFVAGAAVAIWLF